MSNQILVTDTLFIFDEHVEKLEEAGYEVVRLAKPDASEEELCEAIKGKVGYILGGIEKVTAKVIESADELKAIVFTGTGYKGFIPGWEYASKKVIAIANAPYANAHAVAEWLVASALAMTRNLFELGRTGNIKFQTTASLSELNVGIVGLGHVGQEAAKMFAGLGVTNISYWSRSQKNAQYKFTKELSELFSTNDVICVCVADEAGKGFIGELQLKLMKDNALIVSITHGGVIDEDVLLNHLKSGHIRAALDFNPENDEFLKLGLGVYYCSNESTAFNTKENLKITSDMATDSMINLLKTGKDKHRVN